jgi:hypothetical protein
MLIFMDDPVEAVTSADGEMHDRVRIGDQFEA